MASDVPNLDPTPTDRAKEHLRRKYPSLHEKPAGSRPVEPLESDPPAVRRSKRRYPSLHQK